ncbi:MAG TPA: hypothetical protein VIZ00_03180, partial [Streptosporangiaceae bacterium]
PATDYAASDYAAADHPASSGTDPGQGIAADAAGAAPDSQDTARRDAVPAPRPPEQESPPAPDKPAVTIARPAEPPRLGESASTRRRSVVFEAEDELDVPDFLT